jgi:galactose mutarotase-like enzyme
MNSRLVSLSFQDKRASIYPEHGFQLYQFEQNFGKALAKVVIPPQNDTEPADRRYGNPILFPNPSIANSKYGTDSWIWKDKVLGMPPHGFARNVYWRVVDLQTSSITGELVPNQSAKMAFPFDFNLQLTYTLNERGLVLSAKLKNTGKESFPYAFGCHPYLQAPLGPKGSKADCSVSVPAGVRFTSKDQWLTQEETAFSQRVFRGNEEIVDSFIFRHNEAQFLELEDHANGFIAKVSAESSEQPLPYWVLWSASPTSPYVCLEPWTDLPNALNRPKTLQCGPGELHQYEIVLSIRQK